MNREQLATDVLLELLRSSDHDTAKAMLEAIETDAREQGRRDGLEGAAKACDDLLTDWAAAERDEDDDLGDYWAAGQYCAEAIRKLAEKSGGGDG